MKKQYHSQKSKQTNKTIYKKSFKTSDNIPIDINVIDSKNEPFFKFKLKDGYEIRKKNGI